MYTLQAFLFSLVTLLFLSALADPGSVSLLGLLLVPVAIYGNALILFHNVRMYLAEPSTEDADESTDVVKFFDGEL